MTKIYLKLVELAKLFLDYFGNTEQRNERRIAKEGIRTCSKGTSNIISDMSL